MKKMKLYVPTWQTVSEAISIQVWSLARSSILEALGKQILPIINGVSNLEHEQMLLKSKISNYRC